MLAFVANIRQFEDILAVANRYEAVQAIVRALYAMTLQSLPQYSIQAER